MSRTQKPARHRRTTPPGQTLPALDHQALERLASDMHSTEAAEQFAATYIRMLPARVERITQALDNDDEHQALDAVLSLKTSSAMIGALQMEEHCARLENALARTDRNGAAAAGEDIKRHQTELAKELRAAEARELSVTKPAPDSCPSTQKPGTMKPDNAS